jgi:hypothetical protein
LVVYYNAVYIIIEYGFINCLIEIATLKIKDFIGNGYSATITILTATIPLVKD